MNTARILSAAVALSLVITAQPGRAAEGWPLGADPLATEEDGYTISGSSGDPADLEPSPLEKLGAGTKRFFATADAGTRKFLAATDAGTRDFLAATDAGTRRLVVGIGTGTKKLFTGTRDLLTPKKPPQARQSSSQYNIWGPGGNGLRKAGSPKKKSWLDSLFRVEEPEPVGSLKEWVGLPRVEP
jgi:hypothetical protein